MNGRPAIPEWVGDAWEPVVAAPAPRYRHGEIVGYNVSGTVFVPDAITRFRVQRIRWEDGQIRYSGPHYAGYGMRGHWTSTTEGRIDACRQGA